MTLEAELSIRMDGGGLVAALTAELGGATDDLQGVSVAVSADDVGTAGGEAGSIDLSGISGAIGSVTRELGGVLGTLPIGEDLIGPVRTGLSALETALAGNLEADLRGALDRVGAEFEAMEQAGALGALRQLATSLQSAPELAAIRDAIGGLLRAAGAREPPAASIGDLVSSVISALDAIGQMMALETALAEARRLGALIPGQLPDGRVQGLLAALEAAVAAAEDMLEELDVASDAAVDAAVNALATVRTAELALIDALTTGMAFGEATLSLIDPAGLVARTERILERLRGVAVGEIEAALGRIAGTIAPLLTPDLSGAPTFSLDALLDQIEAHAGDVAAEVTALDTSPVTEPFAQGLGSVTGVVAEVQKALDDVVAAIEAALGQVRDAIAALPLDQIAGAIRDVVGVIAGALETLGDVLGGVQEALGDAAGAAQTALARAEAAVDLFRRQLEAAFGEAKTFVDGLGLERIVGDVADAIQTVSDLIGQADMAPYFATAVDAIDTTTGVIEKVPFPLLPDDMEQDVVDLIRPIKTADLQAFRQQILQVLQIGEDGTFTLRPDLEDAVAGVQHKLDALLIALDKLDPQKLAGLINAALDTIREEIEKISPQLDLGPVTEALNAAKAAVAGLDLDEVLKPLTDGFDAVLAEIDDFRPSELIAPLDAQIDAMRQKVLDTTRLEEWRAKLDEARSELLELVDLLDPLQLEAPLRDAFADMQARLGDGRAPDLLAPLAAIVSTLMAGSGSSVAPEAFDRVATWLRGRVNGGAQLATLSGQLRAAVSDTRVVVDAIDPAAIQSAVAAQTARLSAAVSVLAAGSGRDRLQTAIAGLDLSVELRQIGPNHQRYSDVLAAAETAAANLATKGFGEVDTVATVLRAGLAPLVPLLQAPREALGRLGFTRFNEGLPGLLSELFSVATPARLAGILTPIFAALHGRVAALLDGFIQPVRDLIDGLIGIVQTFDLDRLTAALDGVHGAVRADVAAFHPDALLDEVKTAFADAQAAIAAFDPLGPVIDTLNALKATILRVLGKLDGHALLKTPIEIFEAIRDALDALDLDALLDPLLDRLDAIAGQVTGGLEDTVGSFERLQKALPSQVGSTSISASVSVGG